LFIVYLISGSIFDELEELLDHPSKAASALGRAIPSNSRFFAIYIMSLGFGGMPIRLSLIGPLIVGQIKRRFLAKSQRDYDEAMAVPPFDIMNEAPHFLVVLAIASTYCTIAPIVAPFTIVYFAMSYLVIKQQFLCVMATGRSCAFWDALEYDSAGTVMCSMIRYTLFGLLSAVLLSAAYLFVRKSLVAGAVTLMVLPYLVYQWRAISQVLDSTHQLDIKGNRDVLSQTVLLDDLFDDSNEVDQDDPCSPTIASSSLETHYYQRPCVAELDKEGCWSYTNEDLLGAAPEQVNLIDKSDTVAPNSSGKLPNTAAAPPVTGRPAQPAQARTAPNQDEDLTTLTM
jgi:hypothetical protein